MTGEGARLHGGRWNHPGYSVCYMAEHPALALLELMVHLDLPVEYLPRDYVLMTIRIPDTMATEDIDHGSPPASPALYGSQWARQLRTPILWVPSVVVPQAYNIILNTAHPEAELVSIQSIEPLAIDPRLTEFTI